MIVQSNSLKYTDIAVKMEDIHIMYPNLRELKMNELEIKAMIVYHINDQLHTKIQQRLF